MLRLAFALTFVLGIAVPGGAARAGQVSHEVPTPPYDTSAIAMVESHQVSIGDVRYTVSTYRNDRYRCGREGTFPFVVVEQTALIGEPAPLWVLLHGGGMGYYDAAGEYVTTSSETHNDAESTGRLLRLLYSYVGPTGTADTFLGDRVRAGDRVVLGSLCDHDLYLGLGQPYPNNPNHDDTVDGLLADLAMVDAVRNGTDHVRRRDTTSLWILGTSAGAFGAYALAHNLWVRMPTDQFDASGVRGLVLDSGLLVSRVLDLPGRNLFTDETFIAKHGEYVTDELWWIDAEVGRGFDVPLFDTVQEGDRTCGGREEPVADAAPLGNNCAWIHHELADAIAANGDPTLQQVHVYPGDIHVATDEPATQVQDDLRAWYLAAAAESGGRHAEVGTL